MNGRKVIAKGEKKKFYNTKVALNQYQIFENNILNSQHVDNHLLLNDKGKI